MPNEATVLQHPASRPRTVLTARVSAALRGGPILALALVAFGAVLVVVALVLAVIVAPLTAGLILWLAWRASRPGRQARSLVRIRTRLRARSLGLVVLPGAPPPVAVRAAR